MKTKTKENGITKWIVSIGFVLILIAGAIVWTLMNKEKEVDLIITADNISVLEGDSKLVKYETSVKNADIRLRVQNTKIAAVENESVFGKSVGMTTLIITARYKTMVYEKQIDVEVIKKDTPIVSPDKDDGNSGGDDKDDEIPNLPDLEELQFELFKIMGCTVTGSTIEMTLGKTAKVQLIAEDSITTMNLISSDMALDVMEATEGQRVISLSASAVGTYLVTIRIGNKEAKLNVIVKE